MFIQNDTDKQWEIFGKEDPYYGVLTDNKFHKNNLSAEAKDDFFATGTSHVERVLTTIKQKIDSNFNPKRVLDFGCGVGRLVIPFAQIADEVTGVDISDSMIAEAKKNCEVNGVKNINFVKSIDDCSNLAGQYNLIHSYIVFQHIPNKRGIKIFKNLLKYLEPGGICVAHFPFTSPQNKIQRFADFLYKYIPLSGNIVNILKGRSFFAPRMQMNAYNLNKIMHAIKAEGIYMQIENHAGLATTTLYFRKEI